MSLSAVVNIMFNKDKNIYLQESIEDGQYLMLSQPPEIQVKVFISRSDLWSWTFEISPSGDFQKNIPSCRTFSSHLTDPTLTLWYHHTQPRSSSFQDQNIQHWSVRILTQSTRWPYSTSIHIWPHLRHTRWRLLAALHLPFHVKSFWVWYV